MTPTLHLATALSLCVTNHRAQDESRSTFLKNTARNRLPTYLLNKSPLTCENDSHLASALSLCVTYHREQVETRSTFFGKHSPESTPYLPHSYLIARIHPQQQISRNEFSRYYNQHEVLWYVVSPF